MTNTTMPTSWECIAFDGERVPHGKNFVPGPDNCMACKCEKGEPRFCRAALCQPPQDCKSFRVGDSCCDFICLDDILPGINNGNGGNGSSSDTGLRMVASAITVILSLALLLFLIHRLRQRKLRTAQQYLEDQLDALRCLPQESCRSNPCCHNAVYFSGNDHVDFFLDGQTPPFTPWKPPSYYFQPAEDPPPYSEVVASDRVRVEDSLPSLNPLMVQLGPVPYKETQSTSMQNSRTTDEARSQVDKEQLSEEGATASLHSSYVMDESLLSDDVYVNFSSFPERARPLSLHSPSHGYLNNPIRGLKINSCSAIEQQNETPTLPAFAKTSHQTSTEDCNVRPESSRVLQSAADIQDKNAYTRSRQRHHASNLTDEERASAVEDFRLRLRLDISASSTSTEEPSQPFSLGSASSRSSEDAPSIESNNAEANC